MLNGECAPILLAHRTNRALQAVLYTRYVLFRFGRGLTLRRVLLMTGIPDEFNKDFLDWLRDRTEDAGAALPAQSPEDVLAEQVKRGVGGSRWQHGTRWLSGLSDEELNEVECCWARMYGRGALFRRLAATNVERYHQYILHTSSCQSFPEIERQSRWIRCSSN